MQPETATAVEHLIDLDRAVTIIAEARDNATSEVDRLDRANRTLQHDLKAANQVIADQAREITTANVHLEALDRELDQARRNAMGAASLRAELAACREQNASNAGTITGLREHVAQLTKQADQQTADRLDQLQNAAARVAVEWFDHAQDRPMRQTYTMDTDDLVAMRDEVKAHPWLWARLGDIAETIT